MMICRADFEDIFPDLFKPESDPAPKHEAGEPSAACLARWEDDGGQPASAAWQRDEVVGRRPRAGYDIFDLATAGGRAAAIPATAAYAAAAAYAATWSMLSARGQRTSDRPARS